jgi:EAL domain-containing protein (putative c-di-GMP-specific phosphodiesterase class I)
LTETVLMDEAQSATAMLERLAALGVRLAIDDFGTGYSSLGYLRRFPIDHLKVDRSFIGNTADDHEDTILEAVVRLGHALKLRVTAEGVETADQLARLRSLGFDSAQGYHFARPLDAEEAAAYVTAHALQPVISPPIPT